MLRKLILYLIIISFPYFFIMNNLSVYGNQQKNDKKSIWLKKFEPLIEKPIYTYECNSLIIQDCPRNMSLYFKKNGEFTFGEFLVPVSCYSIKGKWDIKEDGVYLKYDLNICERDTSSGFVETKNHQTIKNLEPLKITEIENLNGKNKVNKEFTISIKNENGTESIMKIFVKRFNKYGFINHSGKFVIKPKFYEANSFHEGLALVKDEKKYGFINKSGKMEIEPKCRKAYDFHEGLARFVNDKGEYGFINKKGNVIVKPIFHFALDFQESLAAIEIKKDKNPTRGFIDKTGKLVIDPIYFMAGHFFEGLAKVYFDKKLVFINKLGKVILEPEFKTVYDFHEGLARVDRDYKKQNQSGYIDKTGKIIIEPKFNLGHFKHHFSEGLSLFIEDNKYGYIDKTGKIVIAPQFEHAEEFHEGLAKIRDNNKYGFINQKGEIVIPVQFNDVKDFQEGLAFFKMDSYWGFWGFIDKTGKIVIEPQFCDADNFKEGLAKVQVLDED